MASPSLNLYRSILVFLLGEGVSSAEMFPVQVSRIVRQIEIKYFMSIFLMPMVWLKTFGSYYAAMDSEDRLPRSICHGG